MTSDLDLLGSSKIAKEVAAQMGASAVRIPIPVISPPAAESST
jgi:hypothetical protein